MRNWRLVILVTHIALGASCTVSEAPQQKMEKSVTYWINSYRVPCTGVGPMSCLQVRREESGDWQIFYSEIEGFEYEPGYLYQIRVREEAREAAQVPADASATRFVLVAVEDKRIDLKLRINDIWMLQAIGEREFSKAEIAGGNQWPMIEFHVRDGRYLGNDGCNAFRGSLEALGEQELRLGSAMSTKRLCKDMALPASFLQQLARVDSYEIDGRSLHLLNGDVELLRFGKTD